MEQLLLEKLNTAGEVYKLFINKEFKKTSECIRRVKKQLKFFKSGMKVYGKNKLISGQIWKRLFRFYEFRIFVMGNP